jgi:hypothetical protein
MIRDREIAITIFVDVRDVQQALCCSLSLAYDHLRRAAGRDKGKRGMLRVPVHRWERYAEETFSGSNVGDERTAPRRLRPTRKQSVSSEEISQVIPITQPRTKSRRNQQ